MSATIRNLDEWLELTGNEVSGDEFAEQSGYYPGSLWGRVAEGKTA